MLDPSHIELWLYPALTCVAVVSGFIDAVAGGGGLVMMPILLSTNLPPHVVLGTNKIQSMCGTTVATWRYHKAGLFNFRPNASLAAVVFIGALTGTFLIQQLSTDVLKLVVPILLISVALYTVLSPSMTDEDRKQILSENSYKPIAGGIGFYDGFFGPGTGQFFATTLVAFRGYGLTRATGLTKFLNLTSNIASVIVFTTGGHVLWMLGLCMGLGSMTGAWIGSHFATKFGAKIIRPLLVIVSLGLTGRLIWGWFSA